MGMKPDFLASLLVLIAVSAFLGGCASSQPPTGELAASQQAIRQAEQSGAREYAPVELRNAEYDRAQRLAEQAQVDAELAQITARSQKAQQAVREIQESIRALQEEIQRKQGRDR